MKKFCAFLAAILFLNAGVAFADGFASKTRVVISQESTDNQVYVKNTVPVTVVSGGGSGTQYTDGSSTVAHPVGTMPVFDNAGTITAVSAANPLPVSATISTAGLATSAKQDTGNTSLASIDGKITAVNTGAVTISSALPAGANVIGHVIHDSGSTTAVTGNVATTAADGSNVTLGAKADAKSTATDTTAITLMQVFKEISFMLQNPASVAVTNAGTFAAQAACTVADGANVTLGAKADAKSTATDTTSITIMQVLKEISAMVQAPPSQAVTNTGTFAVQAAITAASGSIASGAIASGAIASGAVASGAFASGSISDGAMVTLGAKADAKSTATDTTAITIMQVLKECSAMLQAPAALPANQSVNVAQINGHTALEGGTNGGVGVGGLGAAAASVAGNPVRIGGLGRTTTPTIVSSAQLVDLLLDRFGRVFTVSPVTSQATSNGTPITTNTNTSIVAAPSAGNHLRIHHLWAQNSSATGTWCYWGNGSGVKSLPFYLAQNQPFSMNVNGRWELSTATALFMNTATTGANIEWQVDYETLAD